MKHSLGWKIIISICCSALSFGKSPILFKQKLSKRDTLAARSIYTLTREMRYGEIRSKTLAEAKSHIKNSKAFRGYLKSIISFTKSLKASKNILAWHKKCQALEPISGSAISKEINNYTKNMCIENYFKLGKKYPSRLNLDHLFLEENLSAIISSNRSKDIISLLKNQKIKNPDYIKAFTNIVTKSKIKISSKLLPYMEINQELTEYIQKNQLLEKNKSYILNKLKAMSREFSNEDSSVPLQSQMANIFKFYFNNKDYISEKYAFRYLSRSAKTLIKRKEYHFADIIYEYLTKLSTPAYKEEAIFQRIFIKVTLEKSKQKTLKTLVSHQLLTNFNELSPKLKFWTAKAYQSIGRTQMSDQLFVKLINLHPLSFYSIITSKDKKFFLSKDSILKGDHLKITFKEKDFSDELKNTLVRIRAWNEIGNFKLMNRETYTLLSSSYSDLLDKSDTAMDYSENTLRRFFVFNLIKLFNHDKAFLASFKLFHRFLNENIFAISEKTIKLLFPFKYLGKVKTLAREIDPLIIMSLIRQESAFDPLAKSYVGARGLMQLMPKTARSIASQRLKTKDLHNIKTNLKLGIKYFRHLLRKYDGDLIYTLSAYNAGEGNLRKWQKRIFPKVQKDPLSKIESIPFKETRNYVKFIYRNYFFYKLLSKRDPSELSLDESFKLSF